MISLSIHKINYKTQCFWLIGLTLIMLTLINVSNGFADETSFKGQGFNSPQAAVAAIIAAAREHNTAQAIAIFGPEAEAIVFSGDRIEKEDEAADFIKKYDAKHRIEMMNQTLATLIIGEENWPFPIPVVKNGESWFFDVAAGKEEILNRRIGENELNVIQVMQAYVEAQLEYASKDRDGDGIREFAQRIKSDDNKKNGLFWPVKEAEELSPFGAFIAEAASEGYTLNSCTPQPYNGYYYKITTSQGENAPGGAYDYIVNGNMILGFGMIAYPAKYGASGIMTFTVNQEGVVYEVDLGENTTEIVAKKIKYNLDKCYNKVCDQDLDNK